MWLKRDLLEIGKDLIGCKRRLMMVFKCSLVILIVTVTVIVIVILNIRVNSSLKIKKNKIRLDRKLVRILCRSR